MYIDDRGNIINDDNQYIDSNKKSYPKNWDKSKISELHKIIETPKPLGENIIISGWSVDENYMQVWNISNKSEQEIISDSIYKLKSDILKLEKDITPRRLRDSLLTEDGKIWLQQKEDLMKSIRISIGELEELIN